MSRHNFMAIQPKAADIYLVERLIVAALELKLLRLKFTQLFRVVKSERSYKNYNHNSNHVTPLDTGAEKLKIIYCLFFNAWQLQV